MEGNMKDEVLPVGQDCQCITERSCTESDLPNTLLHVLEALTDLRQ